MNSINEAFSFPSGIRQLLWAVMNLTLPSIPCQWSHINDPWAC